jgi:hypothetical protein
LIDTHDNHNTRDNHNARDNHKLEGAAFSFVSESFFQRECKGVDLPQRCVRSLYESMTSQRYRLPLFLGQVVVC